uniref:cyclin-Q n=1 Tax=Ciona intestinalis TaxID=7719 RepID=UPI000180D425|nr:cyclin-Q [Ciona intestinalis]|eukprot:XP_002130166.1 cyclin-Q [Ciona intestinalis]
MDSDQKTHIEVVKFIVKCSIKLSLQDAVQASSSILYHRFFKHCSVEEYDPYTIAATAICLATKVEEQHTRLRDIVNVCHRTCHPDLKPLELDSEFWNLRDTIASCELLMLRVLKFNVTCIHPHKYLLHYLMSLSHLFTRTEWLKSMVSDVAWALLNDSYISNTCLNHGPEIYAISVIDLALQSCKIKVPLNEHADKKWWQVFYEAATKEAMLMVQRDIAHTINLANSIAQNNNKNHK